MFFPKTSAILAAELNKTRVLWKEKNYLISLLMNVR